MNVEATLLWTAVSLYTVSTMLFFYGLTFNKSKWLDRGILLAMPGTGVHLGALATRWIVTGQAPFITRYELFSGYVLMAMLMYLGLQYARPALRTAGVLVFPVSLVIMGIAFTSSAAVKEMPETFTLLWILLHIVFAQFAYGAALLGSGLALMYLLKKRAQKKGRDKGLYERLPRLEEMDGLSYRFHGFSFLAIGVMIASGAVWANYAWGNYWSWDPMENWSLVSWLIYGGYLHLRRIHGWKGTKAAWYSFASLVVLLFILAGVGWVYNSIHAPYFS